MAIQNRRGIYSSGFDPTRLVPGEFAVVQSGDPNSDEGYSLYMCFSSGNVQRIALTEEVSAGGSSISWTPALQSGTSIGTLTIDGTAYNILAPSGGSSDNITNDSNVSGTTVSDALETLSDEIANKQDALTFDNSPTSGSSNPVKSSGIYTALAGKGTYSKPSGGIPKTDLASAVQTSLGKADTALQTAPVTSVAGKTGEVTLNSDNITNNSGVAGSTVSDALDELDDAKENAVEILTRTASQTSQVLAKGYFFVWPEMTTLTITCPSTGGPYAFRFTSGSTATTLTMSGITMPDDFTVEANKVYEINVYQGYGLAASWAVSS